MRFICPTWDKIYSQSISLAEKVLKQHGSLALEPSPFDAIIGVSRGGLPLTRIMSDLLGIDNVMITRCEYYSDVGKRMRKPIITQEIQGDIRDKRVLLLDDVADSGESLVTIRRYIASKKPSKITIATLYVKPWTKLIPDFYVGRTSSWIVFPWELLEASKYVVKKEGPSAVKRIGMPTAYEKRLRPFLRPGIN